MYCCDNHEAMQSFARTIIYSVSYWFCFITPFVNNSFSPLIKPAFVRNKRFWFMFINIKACLNFFEHFLKIFDSFQKKVLFHHAKSLFYTFYAILGCYIICIYMYKTFSSDLLIVFIFEDKTL